METANFINLLEEDMEITVSIIKLIFIAVCTQYTVLKITNRTPSSIIKLICIYIGAGVIASISAILRYKLDYLSCIITVCLLLGIFNKFFNKGDSVSNIVNVIICLGINYAISFITIIINFVFNITFGLKSDYINIIIMIIEHMIILRFIFKIKKFKKGFAFLDENIKNDYFNIFVINTSITIIFSFILLKNSASIMTSSLAIVLVMLSIIIYITIKTIITMYYKHKLLVSDLEETKAELESKKKEIEKLEAENLEFSKTSHTISHQLKSLKFKVKELEMSKEIADEIDISNRVQELSNEYYKKTAIVNIDETGITEIDNMLKYMQSECISNNIEFELQLNGNIHYMVNNVIPKERLEILLADHIKDAIIAIKHSNNINKSILVRLGMINGVHSIYIYDSGIEFEKETLSNLGKRPITTHKDEGGTGMGFMNTFDTLKEYNASMIINEIGKPNKDNYTKAIIIKFDNRNNFEIKSYRKITITQ